ncbi:MAG: hypothetical protein QNJ46_21770 [Leptolyngbyaceae cyanobacterium MO_188.B28]|nr:hypothetical protein [Leptolyngbyaceae cyanobacterium MO_188.B28]
MDPCPCCSDQMLRHIRRSGVYWFCRHCYQEMPNLSAMIDAHSLTFTASIQLVSPIGMQRLKAA